MEGIPSTMDSDSSDGLEYDRESAGSPTERLDPEVDNGEDVYSQGNTNSVMGIPMQPAEMHDPGHGVAGPAMAPLDDHENMDVASEDDAMDAGDAMGPIHVQKPPPLQRKELCWLCTFCTHSLAVKISSFISNNAHRMSNQHIAEQVKDSILSEYPSARGARKRDIVRHISFHMLEPHVRLSSVLRSLLSLAESVRLSISCRDPETGDITMDTKQAELYLKIVNQIQSAYRGGNTALLFSADRTGTGADTRA